MATIKQKTQNYTIRRHLLLFGENVDFVYFYFFSGATEDRTGQ